MDAQATGYQSGYQGQGQLSFTQPKLNNLIPLPVVKNQNGYSVPIEVMAGIWNQICLENKQDDLFYDGCVKNLKDWLEYIYSSINHVVLIIDNAGHVYHIAWINKFYQGHGFVHHCSLGNYNRHTWPTLKRYWQSMIDDNGNPIIKTIMGVTPITNTRAVRLLKIIGWIMLGVIPNICYMAKTNRHVGGMISYCVLHEV